MGFMQEMAELHGMKADNARALEEKHRDNPFQGVSQGMQSTMSSKILAKQVIGHENSTALTDTGPEL